MAFTRSQRRKDKQKQSCEKKGIFPPFLVFLSPSIIAMEDTPHWTYTEFFRFSLTAHSYELFDAIAECDVQMQSIWNANENEF